MKVTVYIADGELDLISDSDEDRKTHAKDLRAMGCEVKVIHFDTWKEAEAYGDTIAG